MVGRSSSSAMSPGPMSLMPDLSRPRSANCRAKVPACPAGTKTNSVSGCRSCGALQERREVRIGERHLQRFENLAAALGEIRLENLAGFGARRPVGQDRDRFPAAVLDRPVGDDAGLLAERETGAHVIGRALGHDRGARHHHHRRDLGFGGDRRHCHGARREAGAEEVDFVVDDQLLGQPLGVVGHAGVVADDQLDLLAGDACRRAAPYRAWRRRRFPARPRPRFRSSAPRCRS